MFFVTAKKFSSNLESPHFPMFSENCRKCKIRKRDGHGKSRNGHGKVMDKYFFKYVGTLKQKLINLFLLQWMEWHHSAPVLLAGTADGDVWMWKIPSGDTKTFQGHGCTCNVGCIMPDGNDTPIPYI